MAISKGKGWLKKIKKDCLTCNRFTDLAIRSREGGRNTLLTKKGIPTPN